MYYKTGGYDEHRLCSSSIAAKNDQNFKTVFNREIEKNIILPWRMKVYFNKCPLIHLRFLMLFQGYTRNHSYRNGIFSIYRHTLSRGRIVTCNDTNLENAKTTFYRSEQIVLPEKIPTTELPLNFCVISRRLYVFFNKK